MPEFHLHNSFSCGLMLQSLKTYMEIQSLCCSHGDWISDSLIISSLQMDCKGILNNSVATTYIAPDNKQAFFLFFNNGSPSW